MAEIDPVKYVTVQTGSIIKKAGITILIFFAAAAAISTAFFFFNSLRGARPALAPPPQNIARLITNEKNRSGMPLKLPPGFSLSIFAKDLVSPRVMALDPKGTLVVSVPSRGKVVALPDRDHDGAADEAVTVVEGLDRPHGIAFRCAPDCKLYIAEEGRAGLYSYNEKTMKAQLEKTIADLPRKGVHVTRTLLFTPGPDRNILLISVGSSCNVCVEKDKRRAAILAVPAEGGPVSVFASGLRNAVFMTTRPGTSEIWATEMGRDLLGDDVPPDELDIIEKGKNYGWPYCYGKNVHDDKFDPGRKHACREPETVPSFIDIPAHSAPLGLAFFPDKGWPEEFRGNLLVAYHGSWNRTVPTGYKIVRFRIDPEGRVKGPEDFITGWLTPDGSALGRPVDILIGDDGAIFISDDKAGVIYRVTRKGKE